MRYRLCRVEDIPIGEKRTYTVKNIPIVVSHSQQDAFHAIYAICPHQKADLGEGILSGLTEANQPGSCFRYVREGEILRCPWHGFSFDMTTGACLTAPYQLRVKTYPVIRKDKELFLDV